MARVNHQYILTPGTPIQLSQIPWACERILIQGMKGGTGVVYIMLGVPVGTTPAKTLNAVQLAPASSTAPGPMYKDSGPGINLQQTWIDGDQADSVLVSFESKGAPGN